MLHKPFSLYAGQGRVLMDDLGFGFRGSWDEEGLLL